MSQITTNNYKIAIVSLGCAKNLVDAECMSQQLRDNGNQIVPDPVEADVVIVNTCGFIESAKKEAIDTILAMADLKKPVGKADFLVVTGCLAQRYRQEIADQLPEVDAILGVAQYKDISETIDRLYNKPGKTISNPAAAVDARLQHLNSFRKPSTVGFAYIKIAEGCSNNCSYCAIPGIRGPLVSRPLEEIVAEAKYLAGQGFHELVLIAQDTTRYGLDLYGTRELPGLLRAITALPEVSSIRVLYVYADGITDELIECLASEPKILHYLDLPIQHASDKILKSMNRRDSQADLRSVIAKLRAAMPDLILRTTVMVGFPGEKTAEFNELMNFLQEIRFERLGCFIYSPEEGTVSERMHPRVRSDVSCRREEQVMLLQQQITREANQARVGTIVPVLLEEVDEDGIFYKGRSYGEAPEVDPVILVAASNESVHLGEVHSVRILTANEYEMIGETVL